MTGLAFAERLVGTVNCGGGVLRTTTSDACAATTCGLGGGVPRTASASTFIERGVPGLLETTGVPGSELLEWSIAKSSAVLILAYLQHEYYF